jgi:hypothetical protein
MEWSIDTFIQDNPYNIPDEELYRIERLPEFRNRVFFPDYEQFGYIPRESMVTHLGSGGLISVGIGLVSFSANRLLTLSYSWFSKETGKNREGTFGGLIFILDEAGGPGNSIHLDILVRKRFNIDLGFGLENLRCYPGNFEEKSIACLKQIKFNYDTYARDIISGENWERDVWIDPRDY